MALGKLSLLCSAFPKQAVFYLVACCMPENKVFFCNAVDMKQCSDSFFPPFAAIALNGTG